MRLSASRLRGKPFLVFCDGGGRDCANPARVDGHE